jgi:hypothetical protein
VSPLVQGDRDEMRWYLEIYGAAYTSEPDDLRAQGIEAKLPQWGQSAHLCTEKVCWKRKWSYSFSSSPKKTLQMLMVVSRPADVGFLDPRAEAQAVLAAIEQEASGRVTVEFLRPATLDNLVQRPEDERLPAIDIVHFDGHGARDPDGRLQERAKLHNEHLKAGSAANTGYLLFEPTFRCLRSCLKN